MAVSSIEINNILTFDEFLIDKIHDVNCIIGKNNVGKSNLLKSIKFFYSKLSNAKVLPIELNSKYSVSGSISITYDITRILDISMRSKKNTGIYNYIKKLYLSTIFSANPNINKKKDRIYLKLKLNIYSNGSVKWNHKDESLNRIVLYLFPFFHIEPRHMDLHDWNEIWNLVSSLKSFDLTGITKDKIHDFFNSNIEGDFNTTYSSYLEKISNVIKTKRVTHKEKLLSYIKAGGYGYKFEINESDIVSQSDGTKTYFYIKSFSEALIKLSKREYIVPFLFIDEPELGLHPKMNEELINDIYQAFSYRAVKSKTINPSIFITTHSPSIVKEIVRLFINKHQIISLKCDRKNTQMSLMASKKIDEKFLNIFSDNESRLFFSDFILFVEGETELEVFSNNLLRKYYKNLQKVDIYKSSNNTIGENINPSNSNASTPYLFLFDSDKAWKTEFNEGSRTCNILLQKNGGLFNLQEDVLKKDILKYKRGYNDKHRQLALNIESILYYASSPININKHRLRFTDDIAHDSFTSSINKYLLTKRYYINKTTFEGCLICPSSKELFFKWLEIEKKLNMRKVICRLKKCNLFDERDLINYFRIIFNGKCELIIDYKSFDFEGYKKSNKEMMEFKKLIEEIDNIKRMSTINITSKLEEIIKKPKIEKRYQKSSIHSRKLMRILERKTVKNKDIKKTDGWITSFLNFSILEIENSVNISINNMNLGCNKEIERHRISLFKQKFKSIFPEFHDILIKLQPDRFGMY
ncbi:retron Eco8 family effector endonuclease [Aliivibrio sp. S2MY1]|uniref:retron Eco8 family effector endonuclease n=2 Tax=unclassified Aliivibrio TaxID=2645654 RepID=UPI0023799B9C|nr:retron Eco8 family effector endonuclease [Aliivibrio sp. S2MY1]MDD9200303.1 retron Eco8 family effector endonuclease [Aliivibrio sp. S2MY1]